MFNITKLRCRDRKTAKVGRKVGIIATVRNIGRL